MALFDNGKKEAAENYVLQALSRVPILDSVIETIVNHEEEWIANCQGYYDSRQRKMIFEADFLQIKWSDIHPEGERQVETINEKVEYCYTASGYAPLHNHVNEKGKEDVSANRVIYLWATIVRDRLQAAMPKCEFGSVVEFQDCCMLTYTVPELSWKRWF